MRNSIIFLLIITVMSSCASHHKKVQIARKINEIEHGLIQHNAADTDKGQIQKTYSLFERMAYYNVPGVSIAVINNYQIEWAKGYGVLNAETRSPVTSESLFQAASTTKSIVAVIALGLIEQGLLDLDGDVNSRLISWKIPENSFNRDHKISLRQLLTHRSGLPATNFPYDDDKVPTLVQVLKGEAPARNKPAIPEYIPGTKWEYSNIGYVLIQLLIEDVLGKPLPEVAKERIFLPLGMQSSYFRYPLSPDLSRREAMPHDADGNAKQASLHPTAMAQGGLITTPSDLAKFTIELMRAYQGKSARIISQKMMQLMFHPEFALDPAIFGGTEIKEGLGVFLRIEGQHFSFNHPGDNYPGASCWITGFPESGKGAVIMTNGAKGLYYLTFEILAAICKAYDWPLMW